MHELMAWLATARAVLATCQNPEEFKALIAAQERRLK